MGDARKRRGPSMDVRLACVAASTIVMHPIETIKVRMQMGMSSSILRNSILRNQGLGGLYQGFSGGLLRKLSYTTFLCCYSSSFITRPLSAVVKPTGNAYLDTIMVSSAALMFNNATMSALVLNPVDVVATRMQGDLALHPDLRRNHRNVFSAVYRAAADEGLLALWRGTGPSIVATWAFSFGFITTEKFYHRYLHKNPKHYWETKVTAFFSMFLAVPPLFSQPFDYVKTQMQMMQKDSSGRYPYTSSLDCARKTLMSGGPFKFYNGYVAYCFTKTPQSVLLVWLYHKAQGMKININI